MALIDSFLRLMSEKNASDLHLAAGTVPAFRILGDIVLSDQNQVLEDKSLRSMLYEIASEDKIKTFEKIGEADFAYEIKEYKRYRVNIFLQKTGIGSVFREISDNIRTVNELGLPSVVSKFASLSKGLALVTGPTGCGKSATLAAIIDEANSKRACHVITIEDPIEFVHKNKKSIITHREIGAHTKSFAAALRASLREDPDIIMVGELRDMETIALAMEAASTGHLVLGTLHTKSAAETLERIIQVFPSESQNQMRSIFADSIEAVISQVLLKGKDHKKRYPAVEILIGTSAVKNLIREGKTYQIPSIMQTSKKYGMRMLDDSITDYLHQSLIDAEEAYKYANDKNKFFRFL
ncbi:MAG: type IV pilus twitching motility protein PilT [Deltaproteobacteria bacterium]|nr:type IV pilus twitching motility protein PilT [Deltaproteobacteria bacterium]